MLFTETNEATHSEGTQWLISPVGAEPSMSHSQSVFLNPDKAVASKANDLGPVECQNVSPTSQEVSSIKITVSRMLGSI